MMHGDGGASRGHGNFQHAHELVFENHFVSVRRGLHRVVTVGKSRFVLPVGVEVPGKQREKTDDEYADKSFLSDGQNISNSAHAAEYKEFLVDANVIFLPGALARSSKWRKDNLARNAYLGCSCFNSSNQWRTTSAGSWKEQLTAGARPSRKVAGFGGDLSARIRIVHGLCEHLCLTLEIAAAPSRL
jgi:hypothetical protein